jgi:hypothetical protein
LLDGRFDQNFSSLVLRLSSKHQKLQSGPTSTLFAVLFIDLKALKRTGHRRECPLVYPFTGGKVIEDEVGWFFSQK